MTLSNNELKARINISPDESLLREVNLKIKFWKSVRKDLATLTEASYGPSSLKAEKT